MFRWLRRNKTRPAPVTAATRERQKSERLHKESLALVQELRDIRERNHFAESLRALIERGPA